LPYAWPRMIFSTADVAIYGVVIKGVVRLMHLSV
jgi:hypothetical protein